MVHRLIPTFHPAIPKTEMNGATKILLIWCRLAVLWNSGSMSRNQWCNSALWRDGQGHKSTWMQHWKLVFYQLKILNMPCNENSRRGLGSNMCLNVISTSSYVWWEWDMTQNISCSFIKWQWQGAKRASHALYAHFMHLVWEFLLLDMLLGQNIELHVRHKSHIMHLVPMTKCRVSRESTSSTQKGTSPKSSTSKACHSSKFIRLPLLNLGFLVRSPICTYPL